MALVKLCARIGSTGLISLALCANRSSRIFSADVVTDDRDEMVCGFFSSIYATMRAAGSSDAVRTFEISTGCGLQITTFVSASETTARSERISCRDATAAAYSTATMMAAVATNR